MKKYAIILSLFFISYGCSDDFTNINPKGVLPDAKLQDETGVNLLLAGAYSVLDGVNGRSGLWQATGDNWWFDVLADDAHKGSINSDQADLFEMEVYNWATGNGYFLGKWNAVYAGVNRANAVLALIATIPDIDLTAQEAEARFLRGYFNMELIKIWENVAYISLENFQNQEFNQPNTGPIWTEVEDDFTFAKNNLPDSQSEVGRINTWGAQAFLGKAHLYQGEYAEALTELQNVINNGPYSLLDEYNDNFSLAGENGVESVFAINFVADDGLSYNGNQGGTLNFPGGGPLETCCGFYQPTQDLVNAFQTDAGGLPLLNSFNAAGNDVPNDYGIDSGDNWDDEVEYDIVDADGGPVDTYVRVVDDADAYKDKTFKALVKNTGVNPIGNPGTWELVWEEDMTTSLDPRVEYSVGRRGKDYNGFEDNPGKVWIRASFNDISGPYLPKKNFYQAGEDSQQGTGGWGEQRSGINYNIMRFADVLLMAAEAQAMTNTGDMGLAYVNLVRERAQNSTTVKARDAAGDETTDDASNYNIALYAASDFSTQADAIQRIKFERRLELAMEGHRYFDLVRWGDAEAVINAYAVNEARTITPFQPGTFESKHNRLPIPVNAIDQSGNILTQNEGF